MSIHQIMMKRRLALIDATPVPTPLVTDLVAGFIHGYSQARKLRSAYAGDILEVRRSSDDTATDIGDSSNVLDESALTTFTGAGNGFTRTLYDQVGARNMEQATTGNQPQIVASGTVVKVSGKPYAQYDGTNDFLATSSATPITDDDCTVFVVFESQGTTNTVGTVFEEIRSGTPANRMVINSDLRNAFKIISNYFVAGTGNPITFSTTPPTSTKRCFIIRKTGTLFEAFAEDTKIGDITSSDVFSSDTILELGRQLTNNLYFNGKIAELLINNTALSTTDRNAVLDNIKDFYSIV